MGNKSEFGSGLPTNTAYTAGRDKSKKSTPKGTCWECKSPEHTLFQCCQPGAKARIDKIPKDKWPAWYKEKISEKASAASTDSDVSAIATSYHVEAWRDVN